MGVADSPFTPFDPSSIAQYQSPFEDAVVNSGISDLNRSREMTQVGNHSQATIDHTFGGNRGAVTDSQTNDDFLRAVAAFTANTRNAGYQNAEQTALTNWQAQYQDPFLKQGLLNSTFTGSVLPTATTTQTQSGTPFWEQALAGILGIGQTAGQLGWSPFGTSGGDAGGIGKAAMMFAA